MKARINFKWIVVVTTVVVFAAYGAASKISWAKGGGHGGGGHHGGEHHEGEHHEAHHEEHHEGEHHHEVAHHPFQPTPQHVADHNGDHHDDHHWNHHHHDWDYAGWGWNPGFWGGVGLGYVGGSYWGGGGGNTYVENSSPVAADSAPAAETVSNSTLANVADDGNADTNNTAQNGNQPEKYAVDVWPELGVSTYSGEHDGTKGLVVVSIKPGSVAEKAGLSAGDVILKFDGQPTPDEETMDSLLDSAHGNFKLVVLDAKTGGRNVINGTLDSGSDSPGGKNSG